MSPSSGSVGVIGTGMIGTSIAMAARRAGHAVVGFDADPDVLARAAAIASFEAADSLRGAVTGASIAFVCTTSRSFSGPAFLSPPTYKLIGRNATCLFTAIGS